jgi:hypothetical protein
MRDAVLERLGDPYPRSEIGFQRFATAIGVEVSEALTLRDQIFGDLDDTKFGIGWWAPHPGTARRILISDYLTQSAQGIAVNLIEARLHLLEAEHAMDEHAKPARYAGFRRQSGVTRPNTPASQCAADELPGYPAQIHVVGLFRAPRLPWRDRDWCVGSAD